MTEADHVLGLALGRKINESTVEGRQSSPAANRQGQQMRIGHLTVTAGDSDHSTANGPA